MNGSARPLFGAEGWNQHPVTDQICDVAYRYKLLYEAKARREAREQDLKKHQHAFATDQGLEKKVNLRLDEAKKEESLQSKSYTQKAAIFEEHAAKLYGDRSAQDRELLKGYEADSLRRLDSRIESVIGQRLQVLEKRLESKYEALEQKLEAKYAAQFEAKVNALEASLLSTLEPRLQSKLTSTIKAPSLPDDLSQTITLHTANIEQMRTWAHETHAMVLSHEQTLKSDLQNYEANLKRHDHALKSVREYMQQQQDFIDSLTKTLDIKSNGIKIEVDDDTPEFNITLPPTSLPTPAPVPIPPKVDEDLVRRVGALSEIVNRLSTAQSDQFHRVERVCNELGRLSGAVRGLDAVVATIDHRLHAVGIKR